MIEVRLKNVHTMDTEKPFGRESSPSYIWVEADVITSSLSRKLDDMKMMMIRLKHMMLTVLTQRNGPTPRKVDNVYA